jgi:hypothetical protein
MHHLMLFFPARPANHLTITIVALCHKMFGGHCFNLYTVQNYVVSQNNKQLGSTGNTFDYNWKAFLNLSRNANDID